MIDIIIFVVYLILRSMFVRIQTVIWFLFGIYRIPSETTPVRIMTIIYRRKRDPEEISRIDDFIALHHSFAPLDILDDSTWALYALDRDNAYFVKLPHPMTYYDVSKYPFVYLPLFHEAQQLATISRRHFLAFADDLARRPQPRTLIFTNTARCGSTLFAQMLNHPGHSVVYGEPYPLTILTIGWSERYFNDADIEELLKPVINVLRKDVPVDQLCVLKTTSTEVRLVPTIARLMPDIKHVFMFRRGGLDSVERMMTRDKVIPYLLAIYNYSPRLGNAIGWVAQCEGELMRRLRPIQTMKEWAALVYAAPYACYLAHRHLFELPLVWHHDIVGEHTAETLKPIFNILNLPMQLIENSLRCKLRDSQANTFLSNAAMRDVQATPMTNEARQRLATIAAVIDVPVETFF